MTEKTFEDIQTAIDIADENSTVELEGEYISEGSPINISKSITIEGKNNATLNADFKSTIFNITQGNVILKNINFINSLSINTAAITSNGNLTIENCYFKNNVMYFEFSDSEYFDYNYVDFYGEYAASVYSTNDLTVKDSTFEDNYASGMDSDPFDENNDDEYYIFYKYSGAICSKGNMTVMNSHFKDSTVSCVKGNNTIINSTFTKSAEVLKILTNTTVIGCNFTQNNGYVIRAEKNAVIDRCNFIDNRYEYTYSKQHATTKYPLIQSGSSEIQISNSNFIDNGDVSIGSFLGSVFVCNTTFENNTKRAIDSPNAEIINSTFTSNSDEDRYGVIVADNVKITNSKFKNNKECAAICFEKADIDGKTYTGETIFDNSLNRTKLMKISTVTSSVVYASGKNPQIKLTFIESGKVVKAYWVGYNILKGSKRLAVDKGMDYDYGATVKNGVMTFKIPNLSVGTYKIKIVKGLIESVPIGTITFKITKANTIINSPKITAKYKKSKYFQLSVKHKTTKKPVKNTYVKVKIDKKTYTVKTNSKGIAKINTKSLKLGKHNVVISSGNSNYSMSAKSWITVKR